jgi:hypothetical protein
MKPISSNSRTASTALRLAALLAVMALVPLFLYADSPSWWHLRVVLTQDATPDDYAPTNQGQVKNIAKAAATEMDAKIPGGAGNEIHALIISWSTPTAQTNDFSAVNLGQLKAIARPFYDRLIATGLASQYPWTNAPNQPDDFAVANIGQVKKLFSFELPAIDPLYDGDHNGLPDQWEHQYFGRLGIDPNADFDGDGISNLQEYLNHTDPTDYFNGTLATLTLSGGGDQRGDPGTLLPVPVSVRVSSMYSGVVWNAPVTVSIEQGAALLVADNSATTPPSTTLALRTNIYDNEGYPVAQFYVLLPPNPDLSIIRVSAKGGTRSLSVFTTAVAIDPSFAAPTNLSVTATSAATARLTWTAATSPTTIQVSIDDGKTWITVGTVRAGLSEATVTGLTPNHTTKFRLFSGGTPTSNNSNFFTLPGPPNGSPPQIPPGPNGGGAGDSANVVPLARPVVEVDQAEFDYGIGGGYPGMKPGTPGSFRLYKNKEIVATTHIPKSENSEEYDGSTTQTFAWIPGHESFGRGDREVSGTSVTGEFGGALHEPFQTVIWTDSVLRWESIDLLPVGAASSKTITLSNPYTDADAEAAGAAANLEFYGEFYEIHSNDFAAYFSHGHGNYDILVAKYRFKVNADPNLVVLWDVQFTPDSGGPIQHDIHSWHGDGSTYSPVFLLDPRVLNGGQNGSYHVVLISAELMVDANRDGRIDANDSEQVTEDNPWRWWINDDDDSGDTGGSDMPQNSEHPNYSTVAAPDGSDVGIIDGTRDLVDFFPLYLNISELASRFPADGSNSYTYNLKQEGGSVNFVYTDLSPTGALDYLRKLTGAGANNALALGGTPESPGAVTHRITSEGVALDPQWIKRISSTAYGILLIEGRKPDKNPIVLEIDDSAGHRVTQVQLSLSLSSVEKMYRHKNLMGADNVTGGPPDYATGDDSVHTEPENYPDTLCNNKYFVFVHGYNVNPEASRGWNAEIFKRIHQSGSKARFVGVTWNGADTQISGMDVTVNYHKNVDHAFQTAKGTEGAVGLADYVRALNGNVIVAAHSLGNLIVASAISDWQLSVGSFFMIDAAISSEVFGDPQAVADLNQSINMIHPEWLNYPSKTYATEWHSLFSTGDARSTLSWTGRFANAKTRIINFYSSGEEVLAEHPNTLGDPSILDIGYTEQGIYSGKYAWALQEKLKGRIHELQSFPILGSVYGGWGFTHNIGHPPHTPSAAEASTMAFSSLQTEPVFDPGFDLTEYSPSTQNPSGYVSIETHGPEWIVDLVNPTKGGNTAAAHRNTLLAEMFPAKSLPIGSTVQSYLGEDSNFDMQRRFKVGWPYERSDQAWRHSDIREVTYSFIYPLFDMFVHQGALDHE